MSDLHIDVTSELNGDKYGGRILIKPEFYRIDDKGVLTVSKALRDMLHDQITFSLYELLRLASNGKVISYGPDYD